jgi:hypothetical protein
MAQKDSVFTFDQGIYITKKLKFRNQQVAVLISVPLGKRISLPKSNSVSNYDDNVWEFQNWHNGNALNHEFEMTPDGLRAIEEIKEMDRLDKLDRLDTLDKLDTLDRLDRPVSPERIDNKKIDSLLELKKKIEKEIDQQNALQSTI